MKINKRIEKLESVAKPNEPRIKTILVDLRSGGGGMERFDLVTGEVDKTTDQETIEEWCK